MTNLSSQRLRAGPFPLKRILVLNDLSETAENAAWRAGLLAQEHGAWLRIVHVRAWHEPSARSKVLLEALAWRLQEHLRIAVVAQSFRGSLHREIAAASQEADLLVTGAASFRWTRHWVAGVHPERLVRRSGLPTLVARRAANVAYTRVIVGVQHGQDARTCIAAASGMAGGPHVQLLAEPGDDGRLLPREHAGLEGRDRRLESLIHQLAQATPDTRMNEAPCVVFTDSLHTLLEQEQKLMPDLVVLARSADQLPAGLAPQLTRRLLAHTGCDTLIVPARSLEPSRSSQGHGPTMADLAEHGA